MFAAGRQASSKSGAASIIELSQVARSINASTLAANHSRPNARIAQ